jgi:hypothetical protein
MTRSTSARRIKKKEEAALLFLKVAVFGNSNERRFALANLIPPHTGYMLVVSLV